MCASIFQAIRACSYFHDSHYSHVSRLVRPGGGGERTLEELRGKRARLTNKGAGAGRCGDRAGGVDGLTGGGGGTDRKAPARRRAQHDGPRERDDVEVRGAKHLTFVKLAQDQAGRSERAGQGVQHSRRLSTFASDGVKHAPNDDASPRDGICDARASRRLAREAASYE